jgi:hypothetical protein
MPVAQGSIPSESQWPTLAPARQGGLRSAATSPESPPRYLNLHHLRRCIETPQRSLRLHQKNVSRLADRLDTKLGKDAK